MQAATPIPDRARLVLERVATSTSPAGEYLAMRALGVHSRGAAWVVARPDDVEAALASPALTVPPSGLPAGALRRLQVRMARFCDGADHVRRRGVVEDLLSNVVGIEQAAREQTAALLDGWRPRFDAMPLARCVPVAVLAGALGVADSERRRVVTLIARLCDALAPTLEPRPGSPDLDLVVAELTGLVQPLGPWDEDQVAAAVGALFQARDATAALIGATLLAADHEPDATADRWIELALRHHAPVQCTRRAAVADVVLGGVSVPQGGAVWVMLAAAERGPRFAPATFGFGPHACPGSALARRIARGFVTAVLAGGWRPVPGQPATYAARPNLRLPSRVMVERS